MTFGRVGCEIATLPVAERSHDGPARASRARPVHRLSERLALRRRASRPGSRRLPHRAPRDLAPVTVEAQPLAANIQRLVEALEYLGAPLARPICAPI